MKFINQYKPAFAIWGTKRGKSTFLVDGIEDTIENINDRLFDIRNYLQFDVRGLEIYIFEQNKHYYTFSKARVISDWIGRSGFYCVSLLIPSDKKIEKAQDIATKLNELSNTYYEKYVQINTIDKDTISQSITEELFLFKPLLGDVLLKEIDIDKDIQYGTEKCATEYSSIKDLEQFFEHYDREDLRKYERIVFIPKNKKDTTCSYPIIDLPKYVPEKKIQIQVISEIGPIKDAKIQIESANEMSRPQFTDVNGLSKNISIKKVQKIKISAEGFEERTLFKWDLDGNEEKTVKSFTLEKLKIKNNPANSNEETPTKEKGYLGKQNTDNTYNNPVNKNKDKTKENRLSIANPISWVQKKLNLTKEDIPFLVVLIVSVVVIAVLIKVLFFSGKSAELENINVKTDNESPKIEENKKDNPTEKDYSKDIEEKKEETVKEESSEKNKKEESENSVDEKTKKEVQGKLDALFKNAKFFKEDTVAAESILNTYKKRLDKDQEKEIGNFKALCKEVIHTRESMKNGEPKLDERLAYIIKSNFENQDYLNNTQKDEIKMFKTIVKEMNDYNKNCEKYIKFMEEERSKVFNYIAEDKLRKEEVKKRRIFLEKQDLIKKKRE